MTEQGMRVICAGGLMTLSFCATHPLLFLLESHTNIKLRPGPSFGSSGWLFQLDRPICRTFVWCYLLLFSQLGHCSGFLLDEHPFEDAFSILLLLLYT